MKKLTCLLALGLTALSCNSFAQTKNDGFQCYWMENVSGKWEWVSTEVVGLGSMTKEECYAMDSCDGGQGYSAGGCYKWAKSAQSEREPWDLISKK